MGQRVALPGFEGRTIEVQPPGLLGLGRPSLFVDGKVVPRDAKHQMHLCRNDGTEAIAIWKRQGFSMGIPPLVVEGTPIDVVQPQKWYAWMWCALPALLLVLAGGLIGIVVGLVGFQINARIFWSGLPTTPKYVLSGLVSLFAVLLWVVIATALALYRQ